MLLKNIFILLRLKGLEKRVYKELKKFRRLLENPVQNFEEFLLDYSYPHVTKLTQATIYKVNARSYFNKVGLTWLEEPEWYAVVSFLENYRSNNLVFHDLGSAILLEKKPTALNINFAEEMLAKKVDFILAMLEQGKGEAMLELLETVRVETEDFMKSSNVSLLIKFKVDKGVKGEGFFINLDSCAFKVKLDPKDYMGSLPA